MDEAASPAPVVDAAPPAPVEPPKVDAKGRCTFCGAGLTADDTVAAHYAAHLGPPE